MANILEILVRLKDEASGKFKNLSRASKNLETDWKTLAKAGAVIGGVVTSAAIAVNNVISETVEYAKQVRELGQVTGMTAEDTSRLIQVADDWGVSVANLETALGMMAKNGVSPSIDALAALADEYQNAGSKAEFAEKASKLLGRQWQTLVPILAKGGDALKEQAAAVDESLIMTQQAVDVAREYEVALDNLNDAVMATKYSIGTGLMPAVTDFMSETAILTEYIKRDGVAGFFEYRRAVDLLRDSAEKAGFTTVTAMRDMMASTEEGKEKFLELKRAVDDTNKSIEGMPEIYDIAMDKLREFDIPATDMEEIQDAIALATGKVTEEQLKNRDAVGYLATMLQQKHITWEQFVAALGEIESGAKTAEQVIRDLGRAIDALKSKDITIKVNYKTTGTPNPAAGDIGLAPGSATVAGPGGWDPTPTPGNPGFVTPKGGTTTGGVVFTGPINIYIDGAGDPQATGSAVVKALENARSAGNSGIGFAG